MTRRDAVYLGERNRGYLQAKSWSFVYVVYGFTETAAEKKSSRFGK